MYRLIVAIVTVVLVLTLMLGAADPGNSKYQVGTPIAFYNTIGVIVGKTNNGYRIRCLSANPLGPLHYEVTALEIELSSSVDKRDAAFETLKAEQRMNMELMGRVR